MKKRYLLASTLVLLTLLTTAARPVQQVPITYLRYDTEITLASNGVFTVRETQQIRFDGRYHTAFAEIPLAYVADIDQIRVFEGDIPYTRNGVGPGSFRTDRSSDSVYVDWEYTYTEPGDMRTFVLEYVVRGGLWVYPGGDILEWRAVPADRSGFPVLASRVTVNLPSVVPMSRVQHTAFGPAFDTQVTGQQIVFESTTSIPDGTRFQVQVGFPHGLVSATVQPWQEKEDTAKLVYRIEAMDVDLTVGAGGQVAVVEQQRVAVDAGALYGGHREIRMRYLDAISNVQLSEGDQPFVESDEACDYCFSLKQRRNLAGWVQYDEAARELSVNEDLIGEMGITWQVPPLVKGEATTFRLAYNVDGALRVGEDEQLLDWTTVFSKRAVPAEVARVRIHLPPGVTAADVAIEGGEMVIQPDGVARVVHSGPVAAGEAWPVKIAMPAGATSAGKPAWQQTMEVALAEGRRAEADRARLRMAFGAGALLILFGGLAGLVLVWYQWGRDKPAGPVADYLRGPPSDLPPGIVAYLLDEKPTTKGVLASLFHLANLGLLRITLVSGIKLQRNWSGKLEEGQTIQPDDGEPVVIPSHLVILFNTLREAIPRTGPVSLDRVSSPFRRVLPEVYAAMGYEAERFFSSLPDTVRHRWLVRGQWMVLGGFVVSAAALCKLGSEVGGIAITPVLAFMLIGGLLIVLSRWMPQRTTVGAEEAERWLAFRRYLKNLKWYGDLAEAQRILDRHFAYAVALDVEEVVMAQAEEMGGRMPVWTRPVQVGGRNDAASTGGVRPLIVQHEPEPRPAQLSGGRMKRVEKDRPSVSLPTLDGVSREMAKTLDKASDGLTHLLDGAAGDGTDTPFSLVVRGTGKATEMTWHATTSTFDVLGDILEVLGSSGGGSGGYSGSSSRSSWSSSRSSSFSRSSSSRSSSSRSSGGGGRRGFG